MRNGLLGMFLVVLLPFISANAESKKIKIGVSSALSGDAVSYGLDIKHVLEFANRKLAGNAYELVFQDDRCNGRDAATAAKQLLSVEQVPYVLGYACSGAALAALPILERAKIPTIVVTASAAEISKAGEYIFRVFPSDQSAADVLVAHIAAKHRKLAVLSDETPYCAAMLSSARIAAQGSKLEIVAENVLPSESPDYRSALLKLRSANADAIFFNTQAEPGQLAAIKQMRELKIDLPIYSAYWASSQAFLNVIGSGGDGIEVVDIPPLEGTLNNAGQSLYREFVSEYGGMKSIATVFVTAIEAFRALDAAIRSGQDVKTYLATHEFEGVFGKWRFDKDGEIQGLKHVIERIENGKPVLISEQR